MNETLNQIVMCLVYGGVLLAVVIVIGIPGWWIYDFWKNKQATRALKERLIRELGKLFVVFAIVLALCGPVRAEVYQGNINGFSFELDVKEIVPGLGVMVVWSDGERVGNVGWYQEPETGMRYGQWGVVFAIDPGELTLFSPFWAVFRSDGP